MRLGQLPSANSDLRQLGIRHRIPKMKPAGNIFIFGDVQCMINVTVYWMLVWDVSFSAWEYIKPYLSVAADT